MSSAFKFGNIEINLSKPPFNNLFKYIGFFIVALLLFTSIYTVDANENAVILRLGKYHETTGPGLQFKLPLIDTVEKVKVDYQYKEEFGLELLDLE